MERDNSGEARSFFERLGIAFRLLFSAEAAQEYEAGLRALAEQKATPPAEKVHASSLVLLAALQREGRLLDFLQQDVAGFSDEEVGAAARVVHTGCRKVLGQYFEMEPAARESEGSVVSVPPGFDANRTRLTGNVSGQPPYRGTLKHHGWVAKQIRMPAISGAIDPRVVAPAEVELS